MSKSRTTNNEEGKKLPLPQNKQQIEKEKKSRIKEKPVNPGDYMMWLLAFKKVNITQEKTLWITQ